MTGEALLLTAIYLVMPVGRLSLRHALIGGVIATLLWEFTRHVLAWYYATMSLLDRSLSLGRLGARSWRIQTRGSRAGGECKWLLILTLAGSWELRLAWRVAVFRESA